MIAPEYFNNHISVEGNILTKNYGSADEWFQGYLKSRAIISKISNSYGDTIRVSYLDGTFNDHESYGIGVVDTRIQGNGLGSNGSLDYVPNGLINTLNHKLTPLFHYTSLGWSSSLITKGWEGNYKAWKLTGSANENDDEQDFYLSQTKASDGTWLPDRKIWTEKNLNPSAFVSTTELSSYWKLHLDSIYKGVNTDSPFTILNNGGAQSIIAGGLTVSGSYADSQFQPIDGIHSRGFIQSDEGFHNRYWKADQRNRIWSFANSDNYGLSYYQGGFHPSGEGIAFHFGDGNNYNFFIRNDGAAVARQTMTVNSLDSIGSGNTGNIGTNYKLILGNSSNNNSPNYGLAFWVEGSGESYIQQQRFDGNNTAYRLNLQPYGGELFYGNSEVATRNWVNNNSVTLNTIQNITGLKQFNNTLAMGEGYPIFLKGSSDSAHYIKHFPDDTDGFGVSTGFAVKPYDNSAVSWLLVNGSGAYINGNGVWHAGNYAPLPYYNNWSGSTGIAERRVIGEIAWRNYGNGHTIIDISNGTTPNGEARSNANADQQWAPTYPTLVGWNGYETYGVRVDSCRSADTITGLPPGYFLQAWENATAVGFSNGNPNDINHAPYIYSKSNNSYTFLATQDWTNSKFVNIDGQQDITGLKIIKDRARNTGSGWGNTNASSEYSLLVETASGSDTDNQYTASIGFSSISGTQAGIYVRSNDGDGTSMAFATTNSFAAGPQIAMTIDNQGTVNHVRTRPTFQGNIIWDAGNLTQR